MSRYKDSSGYILHIRDFKNNSAIIEFFGQENGLIHVIAKGIKKNKSNKIFLQKFNLIKIQFFGKSQLKTLVSIDEITNHNIDRLVAKTAAMYLNELLKYSLSENHPDMELFSCYQKCLSDLESGRITPVLRNFELAILKYNGYELNVDEYLNDEEWLMFNDVVGLTCTQNRQKRLCKVIDMKRFLSGKQLDKCTQKRINQFMVTAIDMCFSYRKIYARELLKSLTKSTINR